MKSSLNIITLKSIGIFNTSDLDKKIISKEKIVNLVNYMDVYNYDEIDNTINFQKVSASEKQIKKLQLEKGHILFTPSSETPEDIGHSAVIKNTLRDTLHSYHTIRLKLKDLNKFDIDYLKYCLTTSNVYKQFYKKSNGSTRFTLTKKDFEETKIFVHQNIEEQKKISSKLNKISILENKIFTNIQKLKKLKKGFVDHIFKYGVNNNKISEYEFGFKPINWSIKPIGANETNIDVIDGDRGKNYPSDNELLQKGYCLFLSAKNVSKDGFKFNNNKFISKNKDLILGKGKLKEKDIVITTRGTVGNIAYFDSNIPFNNIRINSGMAIIRNNNNDLNNEFLFNIFSSNIVKRQIRKFTFGSAQPQLTIDIIKSLKILIPEIEEQIKINKNLEKISKLININFIKYKKIQYLKKSIQEKFFTEVN